MTTLDKLSISGIRSYDPKNPVVIKFYKPLTIIIGRNGSGKTTIIEALKYACTGEVPPGTDRGKSFVNDPKAAGASVVKAQIRVAFKTATDKPVIAVNSMQLTQKRSGMQSFKTLEGVIRTLDDNNKETTLSHRCADMKKLVPNLMGVSKAILENVIFCHQEDSCWPLTTSKDLKQRFDDIFAASRYTKALKKMADFRKDQNSVIKEMIGEFNLLSEQKHQMDKIQDELTIVKEKLMEQKESKKKIQDEVKQGEEDLKPLRAKAVSIRGINMEIMRMESAKQELQKQKEQAYTQMNRVFSNSSDEVLETKKLKVDERRAEFQKLADESSVKVKEINNKLVKQRSRAQTFNVNKGKMEAQIEANVKRRKTLHEKIDSMSLRHNVSGYDKREYEDTEIFNFVKQIEQKASRKKSTFEKMNLEHQKVDQQIQRDLQSVLNEKSKYEGNIKSLEAGKSQYAQRSAEKSRELSQIVNNLNGNFADVEEQCRAEERKFNEKQKAITGGGIQQKLVEVSRNVEKNNQSLRDLRKQRETLKTQETQVTRVQMMQNEVSKMETEFKQKYDSAEDDIMNILQDIPEMKALDSDFKKKITEIDYACKTKRRQLSEANTNISSLKTRLKMTQNEVKKLNRKLTDITNKLHNHNVDPDEDIDAKIKESQEKTKEKLKDLQLFAVIGDLYRKYEKLANSKNQCPVCMRKFQGGEKQKFLDSNTRRIEKIEDPEQLKRKEEVVKKVEKALETLQKMRPAKVDYNRIKKELKENKDLIAQIQRKFEQSNDVFDQLKRTEAKCVVDLEKAQKVQKRVAEISQINRMLKSKQATLEASEQQLRDMAGGGRNLKDVEDEMEALRTRNEELNRRRTQFSERKDLDIQEMNDLQAKVYRAKDRMKEKKHLQERRGHLNQEVEDLDRQKMKSAQDIARSEDQLVPLKRKLQEKQEKLESSRNHHQKMESRDREVLNKLNLDVNEMRTLKSDIDNFAQKEDDLKRLLVELEKNMTSLNQLQEEEQDWRGKLSEALPKLQELAGMEQDIDQNLNYRRLEQGVKKKQDDLVKKRAELENVGDPEEVMDHIAGLQNVLEELRGKLNKISGTSSSDRERAVVLMTELKGPKFKDLPGRHRKQMIVVHTTQAAQSDLSDYQKALDKALISFHKEKMKEINANIKDLWQRCYCGNDIDYVQIRSEEATSKKKAYNYCVVMHRGDAGLEMRGRCSAGQRVLACLLIRLALAETFGIKCGLMALDEPTTNLDGANIKALAFALTQIIRRRQAQKNFQLILITHDETFVDHLGQRSFCDFYYRVFKDQHQHSKATRHRFANPENAVEVKMGDLVEGDDEDD